MLINCRSCRSACRSCSFCKCMKNKKMPVMPVMPVMFRTCAGAFLLINNFQEDFILKIFSRARLKRGRHDRHDRHL